VAAWIASAIWCFVLALWDGERPHAGWARAGFAACALGLLTKGLIGVALPGLVIGSWLLATRQWRKIIHLPWVSGLALFVAIALPWFWRAGERYPGLWSYLFGVQQFSRYTSSGFNNVQPWWFYLAGCLLLLFPWAFLAVYEGVARWRGKAPAAPDDPTRRLAVLCWIWLGAIVLFFSIPRSKLIGYILPVLPPLALLAALGWQRALAARPRAGRWFAAAWLLAAALPVAITLAAPRIEGGKLSRDVAAELACRAAPGDPIYALGGYPMDLPFTAQTSSPCAWCRTGRARAPRPATPGRASCSRRATSSRPPPGGSCCSPRCWRRPRAAPCLAAGPARPAARPAPAAGRLAAGVRRPGLGAVPLRRFSGGRPRNVPARRSARLPRPWRQTAPAMRASRRRAAAG
jgi:hypothetical protein